MNTRGSDSTASKSHKKSGDDKLESGQGTHVKVPSAAERLSKPMQSKEIKASVGAPKKAPKVDPVVVKHVGVSADEPPKRSIFKSTFNTHDIMHAPVEKTIQMLDKILAGERLFTM